MELNKRLSILFDINEGFLKPSYYDPNTKRIVNAKEGGLVWLHEKGHMAYEKNPSLMDNDYSRQSLWKIFIFLTFLSLFIPIAKWFALCFLLGTAYYSIYEEYWAWKYALNKIKKKQLSTPRPETLQKVFTK